MILSRQLAPPPIAAVLGALLALTTGCSWILSWDLRGKACRASDLACACGYSCDPTHACVPDNSLQLGDACLLDRQCQADQVCPAGVNQCLATCDLSAAYQAGASAGCATATYCGVFAGSGAGFVSSCSDAPATDANQQVGACIKGDACSPGNSCSGALTASGLCVSITSGIQACLLGCSLNSSPAGTDTCSVDAQYATTYCTPVGTPGSQYLTCLSSVQQAVAADAACDGVTNPCADGQGCIDGYCRYYTFNATSNCPTTASYNFCSLAQNLASSQYQQGGACPDGCGYCLPSAVGACP